MTSQKGIPKWPDSLPHPSRVTSIKSYAIISDDVFDAAGVDELVSLMYCEPESEFALFLANGYSGNRDILKLLNSKGILTNVSEFHYYVVPGADNRFCKVDEANIMSAWQREVVEHGPPHSRTILKLSEAVIRSLSIEEGFDRAERRSSNPLEIKLGAFGVRFDLLKFIKWFDYGFVENGMSNICDACRKLLKRLL